MDKGEGGGGWDGRLYITAEKQTFISPWRQEVSAQYWMNI